MQRADIPELIELGRAMHGESLYWHMNFDPGRVSAVLEMAEISETFFCDVIVDADGKPVGGLLARLMDTFFGRDLIAHDTLFFVSSRHRATSAPAVRQLLERYRGWGSYRGAKRTFLATASGIEPERTARLLDVCGFRQVGTVHEA